MANDAGPDDGLAGKESDSGADAADTLPAARSIAVADYAGLVAVDPEHYGDRELVTQGGMGRVFAVRDRRLRRKVALKELRVQSAELRARFEREVLLTARLQHPSIVSIHEAGRWPSGEPFYAMKLVSGRPLDEVIAGARSLADRLALLPQLLAVADAMAYAHEQRIIHRDLKPQNILCGAFGETVVIDWGLARDLDDAGPEPEPAGPYRSAGAAVATAAGDVLGTPAYMPPEQAEGRPVDERADVYAIGAVLYHLLAGRPPHRGATGAEVLDAVKRGPPPPLDQLQPGVPPDLLAVVTRALARDPGDRYASAGELADDLRRFQAGQLVGAHRYSARQLVRRWLRRHRGVVAVAMVAVVVLVAVAVVAIRRILVEQRRAEDERALAEDNRADAEELMDFMLGDLKGKLQPIGKVELLDTVARKAVGYYGRRPVAGRDEQGKRAQALVNLGDVLREQPEGAPAATAVYREALTIREQLAAADPGNLTWQRDLSISHEKVGNLLLEHGDTPAALTAYRTALAIRERLAAADPGSVTSRRDLAIGHSRVGNVLLEQGDAPAALVAFRASLAIFEKIAAAEPSSARQTDLAAAHNKVGDVLLDQGAAPAALAAYRDSLAIRTMLAATDPGNKTWQRDLAVSHERVGDALLDQGDLPGALADFRVSLAIAEKLVAADPDNATWQRDLSLGRDRLGDVLRKQGDTKGALAAYRTSLAIAEKLARADSTRASWQRDLQVGHSKVGDVLLDQGDLAGAEVAFRASLAIAERLAAADPGNATWQRDLAVAHQRVGDVAHARRDAASALAAYRASLAIREKLAAADPTNATWQRDLGVNRERIGNALLARGDGAGALAAYRASLAISEKLVVADPGNPVWQRDLADSHETMGDALRADKQAAGALAAYRVSLAIREKLAATDPSDLQRREELLALRHKIDTCCRPAPTPPR